MSRAKGGVAESGGGTISDRSNYGAKSLLLIGYIALATAVGALLGWVVVRNIEWAVLRDSLSSANIPLIAAAALLVILAAYLRGARWKLLLQNPNISATRLFLIEQAGSALDTLSPVRVLDEIIEVGILALRDKLNLGTIIATLALQRTLEFAATVLLLGGGALLLSPLRPFWPLLAAGVLLGVISLALLFIAGPMLSRIGILARVQLASQFASAVALLRREKRLALIAFLISVAQAALVGAAGWLVAAAMDIPIGVGTMIVITLGITFFSSTVPGLPMSIGTFEFAALWLLGMWGIGNEQAIAFSLVLHAVLFLTPVLVAVFFLPREGLLSIREIRALTRRARAEMAGTH